MMLEWVCFVLLIAIVGVGAYFFVESARLSSKSNDFQYATLRPDVPYGERADFKYLEASRFLL